MRIVIPAFDPYVLEVIHPVNPCVANCLEGIDVDFVAIHGLNIDENPVHHRDTWTQNGVLWVKDFLPGELNGRCRMMLFRYNVGRDIAEHDTYIFRHAHHLLSLLLEQRRRCPDRPLVFICHEFGGLVAKEAVMTAGESQNSDFKAIFDATKMFVFFNTPHSETTCSTRLVTRAAISSPEEAVVRKLVHACDKFVERIQPWERLGRLYKNRLVVNFYSTNIHRFLSVLVGRDQTRLHLPDYMEKHYPIYGDHSSICKFESADDAGCRMVLDTIVMELSRVVEPSKETFTGRMY